MVCFWVAGKHSWQPGRLTRMICFSVAGTCPVSASATGSLLSWRPSCRVRACMGHAQHQHSELGFSTTWLLLPTLSWQVLAGAWQLKTPSGSQAAHMMPTATLAGSAVMDVAPSLSRSQVGSSCASPRAR
jgi:hypothetical protein